MVRNLERIAEYELEHAGWQARVMEGADQLPSGATSHVVSN